MSTDNILWKPSSSFAESSNLSKYMEWLSDRYGLHFNNYEELWKWSVGDVSLFWNSISHYFQVNYHSSYTKIIDGEQMPDINWFPGSTLNYVEHIFRNKHPENLAIIFGSEQTERNEISWKELGGKVSSFKSYLIDKGVKKGDRVCAYLPNIPEAVIAFFATASIGAIWSSCSPDFGVESVIDRFEQIQPTVFIGVNGYSYNGKHFERTQACITIAEKIKSIQTCIVVDFIVDLPGSKVMGESWDSVEDILSRKAEESILDFEAVDFMHPLYILYSSGTTGNPKAITHCHGGILLEHYKYLSFHNNLKSGEKFFWYSTTGWMMWNFAVSTLLFDAVLVLYEGSAAYPDLNHLWKFAADTGIHHFGTSAAYLTACLKKDLNPGSEFDLTNLISLGSTGSPLPPEVFSYIYSNIKQDIWLCSMSGGTDVCTAFVGGNPLLPVYKGEIQCRALGCSLYAFDDNGNLVTDEVGEMVIIKPMPSMPVYFWNDPGKVKYKESYFETFQGIWRHGDWVQITPHQSIIIYGRSDSTLNRHGVRIGTSEIYRALDQIPGIVDSLIINIELPDGEHYMPLFLQLERDTSLNSDYINIIKSKLRSMYSPRHVPDEIISVPDIPYTISGKKMEAPIKKILMGKDPSKAHNAGAMRNPDSIDFFIKFKSNSILLNAYF